MILVFFLILAIIIILIIINLNLRIRIEDLKFNSDNSEKLYGNLYIELAYKRWNIPIKKIIIKKEKIIKILKNSVNKNLKTRKKINFKINSFKTVIEIGTDNCLFTTYLVAIISILISVILGIYANPKEHLDNFYYNINPVYNSFFARLELNCIIDVKLVHIIYILYILHTS